MVDKNPIVYDILLPDFIPKIMDLPHGYALLIKGDAGTGKSTFAMEICMQYADQSSIIFVSTRTNLEDLGTQYATFIQKVGKSSIKDLATVGMSDERLKLLDVATESFLNLFLDFEKILKEISEKNRLLVEKGGTPRKTIVIIDSIEKMIESIRRRKAATTDSMVYETLIEYARKFSLKLFIVAETAQKTPNDYLVDGIITLYRDIQSVPDRIVRTMEIQKLRNMSIDQQMIVFTLYQGRFRAIPNLKPRITILPIDQQAHALHGLMEGNQLSQLFFINLFQAKNLYVDIDAFGSSMLTMWQVICTVVALLNKIPVLFIAPVEVNLQRYVKALSGAFGEQYIRKYFKIGFVPKPRVAADWTPDYLLVSQSNDFLEEIRAVRNELQTMRGISSSKAVLAIIPLESVFLNYQHETLPTVFQHIRDGIFTEADTILWTNLSHEETDPLYARFVDSVFSRVIFAMKGVQIAKTQILYWMKMPRPAYTLVPKFEDKPFKLLKLDIIPLM
ncbi:MAG: RAD55 family ATPase [Candidatus Sigynarchaeum springense]